MTKNQEKDKGEEENKDKARLWLLGQKIVKKDYKPEAFKKHWSEKREKEKTEAEEKK